MGSLLRSGWVLPHRQAVASGVPSEFPGRTILPGSWPLIIAKHVDAEGSVQEAEVDPEASWFKLEETALESHW